MQFHELTDNEFRRRAKPQPTIRPRLEPLGERILLSTDIWQPNMMNRGLSDLYTVDTNWSENHAPLVGEDVVWNSANNPGKIACDIPSGLNLPAFNSLTFGDQLAAINVASDLTAVTVNIVARSNVPGGGTPDVTLTGATIDATSALSWTGGSVTGSGTLLMTGTGTINAPVSASDAPTLGVTLAAGDGTIATTLTTSTTTQPLVVKGNAAITIANNAEMDLDNAPLHPGQAAVAISNGDGLPHSITVSPGGVLFRPNFSTSLCVVGMGLQVQGGELDVSAFTALQFTGSNSDGKSLLVCCGGQVYAYGSLTADGGGEFYDDGTSVNIYNSLTLGVNANSAASHLDGGALIFAGFGNRTLVAHGGFTVNGGAFQSDGNKVQVQMDAGNVFTLNGGEIDVTNTTPGQQSAVGQFTIGGTFTATGGKIVNNVDSSNGGFLSGTFKVVGNINLSTALLLSSVDLNPKPGVVNHNWDLFDWSGARAGMLTWELPAGWTGNAPDDVNKDLIAHEP